MVDTCQESWHIVPMATPPTKRRLSPTAEMADRLLDGQLAERLTEYREAGVSFPAIARLLEKHGINVSDETIRAWAKRLGVTDGKVA